MIVFYLNTNKLVINFDVEKNKIHELELKSKIRKQKKL